MNDNHDGDIDAFKTNGTSPPEGGFRSTPRDGSFHSGDGDRPSFVISEPRTRVHRPFARCARSLVAYFAAGVIASCGGVVFPLWAALLLAVVVGGVAEAVSR